MQKKTLYTIGLAVIAVVLVSSLARVVFATEPTPQERAAAELPEVLKEIEKTQEYADRNKEAHERREQLLGCINTGNCEGF